jgi:DNA-binding helix-hairpin-helix protein with protein kinase domain
MPIGANNSVINMAALYLHAGGDSITLGPVLDTGGEARVHHVPGHPELLAKIYTATIADIEDKLAAMISAPPPCLSLGGGYAELVWPLDIVRDADAGDACIGYVMRYIHNRLPLDVIANSATCPSQIDFSCRLRLATNVAWMVAELHLAGIVPGDLHLGNILGDATGCVSFIDNDSFQFSAQGTVYRCQVGKSEFIAPELYNKDLKTVDRTPEQDAFSLAIGIFQLLMDGNHAYQGHWCGTGMKPPLNERIRQGIWPYAQPAPRDWKPRPWAPPFDLQHQLVRDAMTCTFQAGHGNPTLRTTAFQWQQLLLAVEKDRAYIDKVVPLFRQAKWRSKSPVATPLPASKSSLTSFRQFPKWLCRRFVGIRWAFYFRLCFRLTEIAAVLFAVAYISIHLFPTSPKVRFPRASSEHSAGKHGGGRPTPKLWSELRDSP